MRYRGREMECLSIMLEEGDSWLEQLAEVLEGCTNDDGGADAAEEEEEEEAHTDAAIADPPRRTSSRAGRGTRTQSRDDADAGARTTCKVSAVCGRPLSVFHLLVKRLLLLHVVVCV